MFNTIACVTRLFFNLMFLNKELKSVKKLSKENNIAEHDKLVSKYVKEWAKYVLKVANVNVSVSGLSNIPTDETVIFVCNHQSFFDIPTLLGFLDKPYGLLSKDDIKKIPYINKWMIELNCVFIDRKNPRSAVKSLSVVGDNLDKGYSMIIFPEGTRSKTGEVARFKSGAFKLAVSKNVSIVPIALNGTLDVFEGNNHKIKASDVTLEVLPKIPVSKDSDYKQISQEAYDAIANAVSKMRQK